MEEPTQEQNDDERLAQLVMAMKDNAPVQDEKHNVHTFLNNVVFAEDCTKIGNLKRDKDIDELGKPKFTVRGCKDMALISKEICKNDFFADYFEKEAQNTLATSLSDGGFLVRQATVSTKQVVDATKRRKINRGWFGKSSEEVQGGDITTNN